jgi:putative FmdB family regulatory protein
MPLYEYQCDNGHRFELIRKFSDPPLDACPTCGAPVRKLFSSPAIQFKGSGFYITDYARKDQGSSSHSGDGRQEGASSDQGKDKGDKSATSDKADRTDKADRAEKGGSTTDASATAASTGSTAGPAKDTASPKPSAKSDKKD